MISSVPRGHQVALTAKALVYLLSSPNDYYNKIINQWDHIWVHWDTVETEFGNFQIMNNGAAKRFINLLEHDYFIEIPSDEAELPAIAALNNLPGHEDNISVYCATISEYIKLRQTYGQEDVNYFRRT